MKCRNIRITCRTDCRKQGERKDEKMKRKDERMKRKDERMKRKDGKMKRWKDNRNPARRSGGFAIRRKKRFDLLNRGICNPPTTIKGKAYSLAADCKSAKPK